ncbi:unnamed protein product [Prunus brigantina]
MESKWTTWVANWVVDVRWGDVAFGRFDDTLFTYHIRCCYQLSGIYKSGRPNQCSINGLHSEHVCMNYHINSPIWPELTGPSQTANTSAQCGKQLGLGGGEGSHVTSTST